MYLPLMLPYSFAPNWAQYIGTIGLKPVKRSDVRLSETSQIIFTTITPGLSGQQTLSPISRD
jgi:hypothetical protein